VAMYKQAAVAAGAEGEADQEYKAAFMEYDKALKVCRDARLKEQDDGAE